MDSSTTKERHCGANWTLDERLIFRGWSVTSEGCWEFSGSRNAHGYGTMGVRQKTYLTHRLAYEAWVGPIPDGLIVRHKCDNPPCINPEHLELGTYSDNAWDRENRGRRNIAGPRNPNSKLSSQAVKEIRSSPLSDTELSLQYGVVRTSIANVRNGVTWEAASHG